MYRFSAEPREPAMLGSFGIPTYFVTPEEALSVAKRRVPFLVNSERPENFPDSNLVADLIRAGMRIVLHDPKDFLPRKCCDYLGIREGGYPVKYPICNRQSMRHFFKDAVFIPHPYVREFSGWRGLDIRERKPACCLARLTSNKRPVIILDANRKLPTNLYIKFHGAENRIYTHFALKDKYPEFKQGGYNLPFEWGVSARKASEYVFAVDMTYIEDDGGGSQYSFMEAWDAGCVNIIHRDWLRYPGEMRDRINCLAVSGSDELAEIIYDYGYKKRKSLRNLVDNISVQGTLHLNKNHNPIAISKRYYEVLAEGKNIVRFPRLPQN